MLVKKAQPDSEKIGVENGVEKKSNNIGQNKAGNRGHKKVQEGGEDSWAVRAVMADSRSSWGFAVRAFSSTRAALTLKSSSFSRFWSWSSVSKEVPL